MRAAVLMGIKKPLELIELTVPDLQEGQVLVRILAAGLCRTQLNEWQGLKGDDPYVPHLLGHEASGLVEKVGPGVSKVKEGDNVVVSWIKGKGLDVSGGIYRDEKGRTINSGPAAVFTEYAVISENRLVPYFQDITPEVAALFGCAVPTGVGVVFNTLGLQKGQSVAVFGVGGVGGAAILGAKARGCEPIIAVDVVQEKLEFARKLGATHVILNDEMVENDITSIVAEGVDAAIEASGIPSVGEQAFSVLNKQGKLAITGHPATGSKLCIDPFGLIEGRAVCGSWGGDVDIDRDLSKYIDLFEQGNLAVDMLISHSFTMADINTAMKTLEEGSAQRIVITFDF